MGEGMKKQRIEINSIKELFANDVEFMEAVNDAAIMEKLKTPTKFIIEVEDLEEKLKSYLKSKNDLTLEILFMNYKRYLYKHILELEKTN